MTENPEIGVFVHIPNPAGFFVQPDRGGGAVVLGLQAPLGVEACGTLLSKQRFQVSGVQR